MNPADIDPSLCSGQRKLESLDDGFSPPPAQAHPAEEATQAAPDAAEPVLSTKSPF